MSSTTSGFTEDQPHGGGQTQVGVGYIPTEEEMKVFRECNNESLWYRSLPLAVVSMAVTQALIAKGSLSVAPKLGSIPKVLFAGFCGYLGGKLSYMKTCQEKFKRLENSPLGDAMKQRTGMTPPYYQGAASELSDPNTQSFETMFQSAEAPGQRSHNSESLIQMGRPDHFSAPVESYVEEEEPRRKAILYEDLRLKNRENYEVTLTQKAETLLKPSPEKESKRPNKEVNIYGDAWEE